MRSLRLSAILLSTVLTSMGAGLGCGQGDQECLWSGNDAGLTFPVCPAPYTSEFMGTIDGMPVDIKNSGDVTVVSPANHPPYKLSMALNGDGSLDLWWGDPYIPGQWTKINGGGTIGLPGNSKFRTVSTDSKILRSCDEYAFLYILHVTGGDLTGCSR